MKANRWFAAMVLLALPVVLFWRPGGFFINDDWRSMALLIRTGPAAFLVAPEGEQWFPFFHAVYYGLLRAIGAHYDVLSFVNSLLVGAAGLVLHSLFRRHFTGAAPWFLALVYVTAPVHFATVPIAFYLCYHLSAVFFLLALSAMDRFLRGGRAAMLALSALCMLLSVTSHNVTWAALPACVAVGWLINPGPARARLASAWLVTGLVMALYLSAYCAFAGAEAATSFNADIAADVPVVRILRHLLAGAVAAPAFYVAWHQRLTITPMLIAGLAAFAIPAIAILAWGTRQDRRTAAWALALNALFFLPVAFSRWHFGWGQATAPRYGVFTLVGMLFLGGAAWGAVARRRPGARGILLAVAGAFVVAQCCIRLATPPDCAVTYRAEAEAARRFVLSANAQAGDRSDEALEASRAFLIPDSDFPVLTRGQYEAIRRFLGTLPGSKRDTEP